MENTLVKIDPKEFGLDESSVVTIEQAFAPKIAERDGYISIYEQLISKEIDPKTCSEAKELRLKLVKVRTGIAEIHKTQKAYFLAAGRFVDAWKNKETEPIEQMEETLQSIEKHYERIEAERIAKLETERKEKAIAFTEFPAANLAAMDETTFNLYLKGLEVAYNARIEEEKRIEAEKIENLRLDKLATERRIESAKFIDFLPKNIDYRNMPQEQFDTILTQASEDKKKHDAEQIRIQAELERLRKENEAKEKQRLAELAEIERKAKIEREKAAEIQRKQQEEIQRQKNELEEKQRKEETERFEKERIEKERIASEKKAAAAPDRDKIIASVNAIKFELPICKSESMQAVANTINAKFEAFKKWAIDQAENI